MLGINKFVQKKAYTAGMVTGSLYKVKYFKGYL
jgi:hypothetical protein